MWQQFLLQQGFRNVIKGGRVTGFQFKMHIPYYRGLWVSAAFRDLAVRVDGVVYPKDKITVKIEDKSIPLVDADKHYEEFWHYGRPATIIVEQAGGLAMGRHKVECGIRYDRSYSSPAEPPEGYKFEGAGGFGSAGGFGRTPARPSNPDADPVFGGFPTTCSLGMVLVI